MRERAAESEAARLDPGDAIDACGEPRLYQLVHDGAENARISQQCRDVTERHARLRIVGNGADGRADLDRKSTRLNSSHSQISYAVFCLKKKNTYITHRYHHI